jgi:hypothetical protein
MVESLIVLFGEVMFGQRLILLVFWQRLILLVSSKTSNPVSANM